MSWCKVRKMVAALAAIMTAGLIWGCGAFQDIRPEAEEEADGRIYAQDNGELIIVGFSQIGSESIWRTANTNSIQRALTKERGYFLITDNARQKQENQIKAIRRYISQRVDYIVLSPITESGWDTVLEEAREAGNPVILADRSVDSDESLYTTWVGTNSLQEGERAARWLEGNLKEKNRLYEDINIVILQGTPGSSAEAGRTAGFDSIASRYGNWHILDRQNGEFTTAKGKEVMAQYLSCYPDIDVVVSQNDDMTFGAMEAIAEAGLTTGIGGDITIISFDAVKEALELVRQGKINVDIECNPEQGEYIHDVIQKLEQGSPVEKAYEVEEMVFTHRNVAQYLAGRTY